MAIKKFTSIVRNVTTKEVFFVKAAPSDTGKLTNKIKKTKRPNTETGSYIKFLKRLSNIISPNLYDINIQRQ